MGGLVAVEDRDDLGSQGAYLGEGGEECPGDGREATEWRGAGHLVRVSVRVRVRVGTGVRVKIRVRAPVRVQGQG